MSNIPTVWTAQSVNSDSLARTAYNGSLYVTVAQKGPNYVFTSTDGITWTPRTAPASDWFSIAYGNDMFVASAGHGDKVMYSADGISWTEVSSVLSGWFIAYGNGTFVKVGDNGAIQTSTDAITWTTRTSPVYGWNHKIIYVNDMFIVAVANTNSIITSTDGITWTAINIGHTHNWMAIAYGNGIYVMVSFDGYIITSTDLTTWTLQQDYNVIWRDIDFGEGVFVASSRTGKLATSTDGLTWTFDPNTYEEFDGIFFGGNKWIALSRQNTTQGILTSDITPVSSSSSGNLSTIFANTTQPKFYWDFRTGSPTTDENGTYVTDIMNVDSQNLKAVAINNASIDAQGALFDTVPNSYEELEHIAIDPFTFGGQHSIEIYFNRATLPNGDESAFWQGLVTFTNGSGTANNQVYRISSGRDSANTLGFANFADGVYPEGTLITSNVWNHLVMTADANGVWKAYLNNTLDTTFSMTHIPETVQREINWVGSVKYNEVYAEHFYGRVGYVRIWQDHVLTASEVSNLYNTRETAYDASSSSSNTPTDNLDVIFANVTNPTYYFEYRKDITTEVTDVIGGLNSVLMNDATCNTTDGLVLDGTNDYVDISDFEIGGVMSFEAYIDIDMTTGSWQRIFELANGINNDNLFFARYASDNKLHFSYRFSSYTTKLAEFTTTGGVMHIVGTISSTHITLYKDGSLINSTAIDSFGLPTTTTRVNNYVGKSNWPDSYYKGSIKYFRLWKEYALTLQEVSNLYNTRETAYDASSSSESYENVPTFTVEENSETVSSASISTQDLTDSAVVGTTLAEKRNFTKNAVINMFDSNPSAVAGKKLVLKAGAVLPGFSNALVEDTILVDGRTSATLAKTDIINKSFYIPMEVNSVVTLASFNDTVTITQNTDDFTIATSVSTTTKVAGDSFTYDSLTIILGSVYGSLSSPVICFKEGTNITCLDEETQEEVEKPIETLQTHTYVKTYKHGFIKVKKVSCRTLDNPKHTEILKNRLYVCDDPAQYEGLYEPLVMTGCHAVLTDTITDKQKQLMEEHLGRIFITDDKYRLLSMYDDRAKPYCEEGEHKIWHVCLEHYDPEMNYGIYANGLLVESCCEINIDRYG